MQSAPACSVRAATSLGWRMAKRVHGNCPRESEETGGHPPRSNQGSFAFDEGQGARDYRWQTWTVIIRHGSSHG